MMRSAQLECGPWCSLLRKKSGCGVTSKRMIKCCTFIDAVHQFHKRDAKKNLDSKPHSFLPPGRDKERNGRRGEEGDGGYGIGAFRAEALAETPLEVLSRPPPETSARTA